MKLIQSPEHRFRALDLCLYHLSGVLQPNSALRGGLGEADACLARLVTDISVNAIYTHLAFQTDESLYGYGNR